MPTGQQETKTGQEDLGKAASYFQNLLGAGRTETAQRIAPAINAAQAGTDAQKVQAATIGTSRSGGTAAHNAEADQKTNANIDNMISQALQSGQMAGATGLERIGSTEASLGAGTVSQAAGIEEALTSDAIASRVNSANIAQQQGQGYGALLGMLLGGFG